MLQLARQARSALKSPFVCPACRVLLVSGFGALGPGISAARLPTAVAKICATRHQFYATKSKEAHEEIDVEKPAETKETKGKKAKKEPKEKKAKEKKTTTQVEESEPKEKKPKGWKKKELREKKEFNEDKTGQVKSAEKEKLELWKQTLDVLKEIKDGTAASIPVGVTAGLAESAPTKQGKKSDQAAGEGRSTDKVLAGALTVLRRVLRQEAGASSKAAAKAAAKAAPKAEPPAETPSEPKKKASPTKATKKSITKAASKTTKASKSAGKAKEDNAEKTPSAAKRSAKSKKQLGSFAISSVNPDDLTLRAISKPQPPVPGLAYGLDRVLFNPGVYHLQDPRSRVYNFDPYLGRIMPVAEFDFQAIKQYVTSSKDTTLISTAAQYKKKYTGSTSSMTSTLAHFHYLLSSWRPLNAEMMSRSFEPESEQFTRIMRAPSATFLHWRDGTYAIDADKEFDTANVLSMLGKSMEKLLTLPKEHFEKYRKTKSDQLSDEERNGPEAYHYTTLGDFMMRSQLDAFDPRVPGSGMFDLKTRAVISIRMDAQGYEKGLGYEIRKRHGQWQSYEREYYDMIRSAFLKYSLQVRMGRMDGIFVAFHNTERIFGFQYIPLPEMDLAIHGTQDVTLGNREFKLSIHLLNQVLDKATKRFPKQTLRLHFETRPADPPYMYIFAKPVTPEEIQTIQGASAARIEEFERRMMGLHQESVDEIEDSDDIHDEEDGMEEIVDIPDRDDGDTSLEVWEDAMLKVEDALANEEHGVTAIREAIQEALLHSGLIGKHTPEETERYVDALLSAMTSEAQSQASKATALGEENVEESDDVSSSESLETAESAAEAAEKEPESDVIYEDDEADVEADSLAVDGSAQKEQSLKDLIQRLAKQVQSVPKRQAELRESAETLRLREFERILSELVTKSQQLGELEVEETGEDVEATSSSPQELAGADASEVQESERSIEEADEASESTELTEADQSMTVDESIEGVYGLILTVRNKVGGQYVERPQNLTAGQSWDVEYAMEEIEGERAEKLYKMCLARRKKTLQSDVEDKDTAWNAMFSGKLAKYSKEGRRFRISETRAFRTRPVHVYGEKTPFVWSSVFDKQGNALDTAKYKPWVPTEAILDKYRHNTDKLVWLESLIDKDAATTSTTIAATDSGQAANAGELQDDSEGVVVEEKSEDHFGEDIAEDFIEDYENEK